LSAALLFAKPAEERQKAAESAIGRTSPSAGAFQRYHLNDSGALDPEAKATMRRKIIAQLNGLRNRSLESQGLSPTNHLTAQQEEEIKVQRQARLHLLHTKTLEKYDLNRNGVLDPEERKRMLQDNREWLQRLRAKALERFDLNKNGVLDPEEREAMRALAAAKRKEFLDRYDTNHDGRIDEAERAAAVADLRNKAKSEKH
jgi:hypothetical protein